MDLPVAPVETEARSFLTVAEQPRRQIAADGVIADEDAEETVVDAVHAGRKPFVPSVMLWVYVYGFPSETLTRSECQSSQYHGTAFAGVRAEQQGRSQKAFDEAHSHSPFS
jgi:hypothetical protein